RKMQRELARLERRRDVRARLNEKARWKQMAQAKKTHPKARRWK
ncbi:MAG: ribosome small subunit-dependent GTPase, partial [Candidatus Eisenbacteria bacterium]|nr:ribosome small subunit-dependent GTPase [Candidatus Eisenbacteria bacterium]